MTKEDPRPLLSETTCAAAGSTPAASGIPVGNGHVPAVGAAGSSSEAPADSKPKLYTAGTSDVPPQEFLSRLSACGVSLVVDVRSVLASRRTPWCDKPALRQLLASSGIGYVFLGSVLGGRPSDPGVFTDGAVDFDQVAAGDPFKAGLDAVRNLSKDMTCCLLCAEGDPLDCHRMILVSRWLRDEFRVLHIRRDGSVEPNEFAERRLVDACIRTPSLFTHNNPLDLAYQIRGQKISWRPK